MNMAWKSGLRREPVDLLSPNPYYLDLVERLLHAQKARKTNPCRVYLRRWCHDFLIRDAWSWEMSILMSLGVGGNMTTYAVQDEGISHLTFRGSGRTRVVEVATKCPKCPKGPKGSNLEPGRMELAA